MAMIRREEENEISKESGYTLRNLIPEQSIIEDSSDFIGKKVVVVLEEEHYIGILSLIEENGLLLTEVSDSDWEEVSIMFIFKDKVKFIGIFDE